MDCPVTLARFWKCPITIQQVGSYTGCRLCKKSRDSYDKSVYCRHHQTWSVCPDCYPKHCALQPENPNAKIGQVIWLST